ncbi:hypothetical protein GCM10022377_09660 [Zhihengliuella alba]|uniref:HTH gntR-type domain-containing protein n=1 Tax=Zhihengliuella alba TaxID=547018 RepID=A0ABP7D3P5_9MICC
MTVSVTIDLEAPTPPYEQIRQQIAASIMLGDLGPGERLPTVRALAADLGVSTGTVNRAYRELESKGLIASRRRAGTVVSGSVGAAPSAPVPSSAVDAAVDALVTLARGERLPDDALIALLSRRLKA